MIMCATMIIFGIFLILSENINNFVAQLESEQEIQVFINDDTTQEQIDELGDKIRNLSGVGTIEFVSKDEAFELMKERFGDHQNLLEGYDDIFPASYIVNLADLTKSQEIQDEIKQMDHIKEITSSNDTIIILIKLANGIKIVTGIILILLIIISIFIIANTIKLTVHARRKEISIMKYVGATNNFIRWPFVVEGMIIGIIASAISIIIVGVAYNIIAEKLVNVSFMRTINMNLVPFGDMFNSIILVYMLLGIGIGAIGSVISMRKYLKV